MKKNFFFGLFALATMMVTSSCSEQELVDPSLLNGDVVTFTVNLQQSASTRAAAELAGRGTQADKLYYGVYEKTSNNGWALIPAISALTGDYTNDTDPATIQYGTPKQVEIKLAKQKEYSVIFWAANDSNDICDINWATRTMTMKDGTANKEYNDAFWAYETVKINGAVAKTVELYRPFAQLNIGASIQDIKDAADAEMVVETSQIVLNNVANTFNMETGEATATDDAPLTYSSAAILNLENWKFPVDGYKYLALGYVLVDSEDKALVDVELAYTDTKGNDNYKSTFTSVPVQRNYRTNIYGNLLSNSADYEVDVKPGFGEVDNNVKVVEVSTSEELMQSIENIAEEPTTIVLTEDIDLSNLFAARSMTRAGEADDSYALQLAAGRILTLDLNGKSITGVDKNESKSFALIQNNGTLTIRDSGEKGEITLVAEKNREWNAYSSVVSNQPGGSLTVVSGLLKHLGGTDMAYGIDNLTNGTLGDVKCTINGGTIKSTYRAVRQFLNSDSDENELIVNGGTIEGVNKSIWMQDPSTKSNKGKLVVAADADLYGDVYLSVTAGSTAWPVEVSIAKAALQGESTVISANLPMGYVVEEVENVWSVQYYEVNIDGVKYNSFTEAIANNGEINTVTLLSDVTLAESITLPAGIKFDGNGKQINGEVLAAGNLEFLGHTKVTNFNAGYGKPTITIGAGACLELTGTGRMVIGHGATFNITGQIAENAAKTTDKASLTPSLIMPGASFTGAGLTFNVKNAYITAPSSYCSSSKTASGTFDFNIENSILDFTGKLAFEEQSVNAKVNFALVNSVLTTGSHLVFGTASGEEGVVIDNSDVNKGTSRQIENCGNMIVKNCAVVNGAVATSSNAKNPGTLIVENATYAVTGEFSGSDIGTGTLIVKKGASFIAGSITKANIIIDAAGMEAGDTPITADLSKHTGTLTVINNESLCASKINNKIVLGTIVAMIGDTPYTSLIAAIQAVQDGDEITLVADETFTATNYSDNGGWRDGIAYSGDKSFTIDLDGHTVSQDGSLNDYLFWFKNVGTKENTITIKNGTLDAGTTAYCALCTASSHENKLTINTEDLNLVNNKSDGSTVKIRAKSVYNAKSGTKITGKNSYLGIENWNATINIYDGTEIYMNGTSSYNGCLVGVGGGGTINVNGGYGKGVKGGFIAMTSGGTINISGGEWIANTDGTIGNNSNLYVLTAQSNSYESGFAGGSYINVTGGTFRGGMDAWVLNNKPEEDADLTISGGNFNANPKTYLGEGCTATENNGIWTVN